MSSVEPSAATSAFRRRFILGVFCAALLVNLWAVTRYWNASLRDAHEFRQHQTALTALFFQKDGLRLDYETPVLGPPWSIPMEFPLYQAVVAKLSNGTGLPLEQAGRLTSILFFYATLPAVWLLLRRRLVDPLDGWLVLAAILVCPLYLFYSRTFLIESTALCMTAWFLVAFDRALDRPRSVALFAAWVFGALAAATKVTTFAAFWIAIVVVTLARVFGRRRSGESWSVALGVPAGRALLAMGVPLLAGVGWVVYSDHLKELNPYGRLITSESLRPFNVGTLAQRFSAEWWRGIGVTSFKQILVVPGLVLLLGGIGFVDARTRRLAASCAACYAGGFLLFANLYYIHDYYFYASAVFLLAAFGLVAAGLLRSRRLHPAIAALLIVGALAFQVRAYHGSYYTFFLRENAPPPHEAEIIRAITPPDDVVAGFGFDWSSILPYYAQRRAIMPFSSHTGDFERLDESLAHLEERRVSTVLISSQQRGNYHFTGVLIHKLQLVAEPIARTADMDIYVRRDRVDAAVAALRTKPDWGAELNLAPKLGAVVLNERHDLTTPQWANRFGMTSPAPFLSKGPEPVGVFDFEGAPLISTQAPTEIHFHPPPGSRSFRAVGGMLPASYSDGNRTPGVVITVYEELPNGTRRMLFERMLTPLVTEGDRGDITIAHSQELPFEGTLIFAHYPVPSGDVSYSWSYWKSIAIQ